MKTKETLRAVVCTAAVMAMAGCAGLSDRDQRIGSGAVAGGVIGNVLGGGAVGTVGGAAIGGLIGNEVDKSAKDREDRSRYNDCRNRYDRRYC